MNLFCDFSKFTCNSKISFIAKSGLIGDIKSGTNDPAVNFSLVSPYSGVQKPRHRCCILRGSLAIGSKPSWKIFVGHLDNRAADDFHTRGKTTLKGIVRFIPIENPLRCFDIFPIKPDFTYSWLQSVNFGGMKV